MPERCIAPVLKNDTESCYLVRPNSIVRARKLLPGMRPTLSTVFSASSTMRTLSLAVLASSPQSIYFHDSHLLAASVHLVLYAAELHMQNRNCCCGHLPYRKRYSEP